MEHAGDVRRGVASICDRSFDLISILGKNDFEPNSYIGTQRFLSPVAFSNVFDGLFFLKDGTNKQV